MSQDGLYDWIAHQDCLPREVDDEGFNAWYAEMVRRPDSPFEALLRYNLGCVTGDLLDAALRDEFMRRKFNLHERAL